MSLANLTQAVQLRSSAAALTTVGVNNDAFLTDVTLPRIKHGIFFLAVTGVDHTTGDETYTFNLVGKHLTSDTPVVLATITIDPTQSAKHYWAEIGQLYEQVALQYALGGTTPSVVAQAAIIATGFNYVPGTNNVIVS